MLRLTLSTLNPIAGRFHRLTDLSANLWAWNCSFLSAFLTAANSDLIYTIHSTLCANQRESQLRLEKRVGMKGRAARTPNSIICGKAES